MSAATVSNPATSASNRQASSQVAPQRKNAAPLFVAAPQIYRIHSRPLRPASTRTPRGLSEVTVHNYVSTIRQLACAIGLKPTPKAIEQHIERMHKSGASYSHIFNTSIPCWVIYKQLAIFYRHMFRREDLPPNTMDQIDFTKARLRFVNFRKLKLDRVSFPQDSEHLVLTDYCRALERAISRLRDSDDPIAKRLVSFLSNGLKWAVEGQQGILNMADLRELGESAPQLLLAAL